MARENGYGFFIVSSILVVLLTIQEGTIIAATHSANGDKTLDENYTKNLENWMDPGVNPCQNFYRFVCGGMIEAPRHSFEEAPFIEAQDKVDKQLIEYLEKDFHDETDSISLIKNAKSFYKACMNTNLTQMKSFSAASYKEFKDYTLKHIEEIGGWPVLGNNTWDESKFDWQKMIVKINNESYWLNGFFSFYPINSTNPTIFSREPKMGLWKRDFLNASKVSRHLEIGIQDAVDLGADPTIAREQLTKVVEFETELAHILLRTPSGIESIRKDVTLAQLMKDYPFYPWDDYIRFSLPPDVHIGSDQRMTFENYYNDIGDIFKLVNKTDKKILANYIAWIEVIRIIEEVINLKYIGFFEEESKDRQCLKIVRYQLFYAMSPLYARRFLKPEDWQRKIKDAEQISATVREQFIEILSNATWLSEITRRRMIEWCQSHKLLFAYSDELYDATAFDEHYKDLKTNESNFVESLFNVRNIFRNKESMKFTSRKGSLEMKWVENALLSFSDHRFHYENGSTDSLISLIKLASDRFFDSRRLNYIDYGRFGTEIGWGLGEIFNYQERILSEDIHKSRDGDWWSQFNSTFQLSRDNHDSYHSYWWSEFNSTFPNYNVDCLENRFRNFVDMGNISLANQSSILSEWITDSLGFKAAYLAYKNLPYREVDRPLTLHGKSYNRNQLFWMAAASTHCRRVMPLKESLTEFSKPGGYYESPPHELRALATFSIIKQFSEDFQCPENSPMNPPSKCTDF